MYLLYQAFVIAIVTYRTSHVFKVFQSHIKETNLIKYITFSQVLIYVHIMHNMIYAYIIINTVKFTTI